MVFWWFGKFKVCYFQVRSNTNWFTCFCWIASFFLFWTFFERHIFQIFQTWRIRINRWRLTSVTHYGISWNNKALLFCAIFYFLIGCRIISDSSLSDFIIPYIVNSRIKSYLELSKDIWHSTFYWHLSDVIRSFLPTYALEKLSLLGALKLVRATPSLTLVY